MLTEPWMSWPLLAAAAVGAGALNAVAGGGSFLTFPALVAAGVPPIQANATSTLAVCPGYLGSSWGQRHELMAVSTATRWREAALAALGGALGAGLLLVTPARLFVGLVPWLLLLATLVFAVGPWWMKRRTRAPHMPTGSVGPTGRLWGLALVSVYGGYFNGGLGILLMALYTLTGEAHVHRANALKNGVSLVLSVVAVATLAVAGTLAWPQGLWMMAWATLGGYLGARLGRHVPAQVLRWGVIATGLAMSAAFFATAR